MAQPLAKPIDTQKLAAAAAAFFATPLPAPLTARANQIAVANNAEPSASITIGEIMSDLCAQQRNELDRNGVWWGGDGYSEIPTPQNVRTMIDFVAACNALSGKMEIVTGKSEVKGAPRTQWGPHAIETAFKQIDAGLEYLKERCRTGAVSSEMLRFFEAQLAELKTATLGRGK